MTGAAHPTHERLASLAEGLIGALERSRLERHVSECAQCSAELNRLTVPCNELTSKQRTSDPGVLERAKRLLAYASRSPAMHALKRIVGVLRFDSASMTPAFGMRGSEESGIRQLLFEAGPFEIEVHTRSSRTGWDISGQVLGPTAATSGEVRLIGSHASARSSLSELLEFKLPRVPAGRYRLELHLASDALLQLDALEFGP